MTHLLTCLGSWFPLVLVGCFNVGDLLGKRPQRSNPSPNPNPNLNPDPIARTRTQPQPRPGKSLPARVRLVGRRALPWWTLLHGGYVLLFLLLLQPALLPPPLQVTHIPACEGGCHLRLKTNVKPAC